MTTRPARAPRRPANLFQALVLAGLAGRRALAVRVGVPLLLGSPLLLAPVPARIRSGGMTLLVLFVALFGAVVANSRLRTDGLWERVQLLPVRRLWVGLDVVLAGAVLDLLQTAPVLALFLGLHGRWQGLSELAALAGFFTATLVFSNALGMLIAGRVRSNAEAHLFGALAVGLVGLGSGAFPAPERIAPAASWMAPWLPPHHLLAALRDAAGAGPVAPPSLAGAALLGLAAAAIWARAADRFAGRG